MSTFMPVAGAGGLDSLLAGLVSGTPGAAPAGTAVPTGLEGLFGALLGGTLPATTGVEANALLASLTSGTADVVVKDGVATGDVLQGLQKLLPLMQQLDLGNGLQLELQGAGVDVAVLQQTITQLTVTLQQAGIDMSKLGTAGELAQALVVQGMDPEEAAAKATALETMLAVLKEKLDLDDGAETGALAVLLLAGAMQPLPLQQAVTVTLRHETQSVQVVNVNLLVSTTKAKGAYGDKGGDVLARLLSGTAKEIEKEPVQEKEAIAAPVAAAAPGHVAVETTTAVPVLAVKPEPHLDNSVNVNANVVAQVVTVAPKRAVQEVAKEDVLEPVDGETMFKMKEGRDGALTVEATPAAGKLLEQQLNASQSGEPLLVRHGSKEGAAVAVQTAWPFADQVAAAAKARVSEQAVVQIKSLVGEGGGTVRMMLNPPELGEVRIELVIKNGEVTGTLAASDVAVVHELSRDLAGLKQAFADAGLKLGQDGLNVALNQQQGQGFGQGQQGQHAQQAQQQGGFGSADAGADAAAVAAELASATRWVSPDSLVDVEI